MPAAAILGPNASESELRPFRECGVPIAVTDSPQDAEAVLILGGDGTIHRQLARLARSGIPMLPVPHGSGNDFARALGLLRPADALAAWRKFAAGAGSVRDVDLGVIRSPATSDTACATYFCCVGGAGVDAEANRRANAMPAWLRAHGGYVLAALAAIAAFHPCEFRIAAEGAEAPTDAFAGRAWMVAFANASAYGAGMKIAPRALPDDGRLDLCLIRDASRTRLMRCLHRVYSGRHIEMPEVTYYQAERVRIETATPLDVYADGEYICQTPIEVSVERRALRVIG
ncbi:MAG TPA: diacylglycerol kinase family protein [Terriglobales bacterium]|nr:diacylglycerol kinase family protein [Terriglobales bacterium]